ncbi:MAG: MFS transporter [Chloroflexota bacterium]
MSPGGQAPKLRVLPPAPAPPSGPQPEGFRRGFVALRHRNYRLYWFGQIASLVGTWMQSVSQPWLVLQLGGSPLQLGTVLALQFAPAMFLAPLGGVLADRVDKRNALRATQSVALVQAAVLCALTFTGVVEIWHIYILATVLGVTSAVDMPIRQSFAAELVPRDELVNAIALNSTSFNLARVIGPAIAGLTLAVFGTAFNFGLNAVSYLAVLVALTMMDASLLHRSERPEVFPSVRSSLAEGFRYAVRTPHVLWPLLLLGGMATFAMNFQTLLPLFARNTLGLEANGYGALYASMGAGSLMGSLMLAFARGKRPLIRMILGGGLVFLAFEVLLGLTRSPLFAFPIVIVIGFASMLMVNTINVTVQHRVPNELRGRVMSLYVTVFAGTAPIGGIFAGLVAQLWGAPAGFVLGAAFSSLFLAVVAWQLLVRRAMAEATRSRPLPARVVEPPDASNRAG